MINYTDLNPNYKAFILELDEVLYPQKDYWYQVYYLFAGFLEYTEMLDAQVLVKLMTQTYEEQGPAMVFDVLQQRFKLDEKYRFNFEHLKTAAQLPLKLLLFEDMLALLQDIVVDRKQIFIVTNGNPQQQLNNIKHTDWQGLEKYLVCYFADEVAPKPEPDIIHTLLHDHQLQRRDVLMIGHTETDQLCAEACGIDYLNV